jgi:RecA-family ATPase
MPITYAELLNSCRITQQTPVPLDNIYLTIGQNIIGSTGNFVALTGLPGASKSTFVSAIVASAVCGGEVLNFKALMYENKNRVCLFDTEQLGYDLHRKLGIIKRLSRRENIFDNFDLFSVVDHDADTIIKLIITYLNNTPECAILIIDGLLDLANGLFNDEKASTTLIRKIRKIARKYDILIIVVLHLGKKDNTALGHLGSASTRYCQSELEIVKNKDGTYQCSAKKTRSAAGFEDIKIMYSEIEKRFILI